MTSSALTKRFLGRLEAKPKRCSQFRQLLRLRMILNRPETNCLTTFQFQFAKLLHAAAGNSCIATFNSACCAWSKAGGTPGLLEYQGRRPSLAKSRCPASDSMWVPLQRPRRG